MFFESKLIPYNIYYFPFFVYFSIFHFKFKSQKNQKYFSPFLVFEKKIKIEFKMGNVITSTYDLSDSLYEKYYPKSK